MRVEVNDEAGRLRRLEKPLKCDTTADRGGNSSPDTTDASIRHCELPACGDCGDIMVVCRCNPGES